MTNLTRSRTGLLVLCGAGFLESLDISMVSIALPSIGADLGVSAGALPWVLGAYSVGYGGFLLLGGRVADLVGRRRAFLGALGAFAAVSLVGATASDGALLIAVRLLTGVAAGFAAPAGLSLVTTTFAEGAERNRALAVYTATSASGFTFGLVLGGLLTSVDWRLTFALPALAAAALVVAGRRVIAPGRPAAGRADPAGAVAVTAAMLVLVYAITQAPGTGWGDPATLGLLAAAVALATGFVAIERRAAAPLVRFGILRAPGLARANLVMATIGAFVAFQYVATVHLQDDLGRSAIEAALAFLPGGLVIALGAPRVGAVVTRLGPGRTLAAGMLAFAAGYALFASTGVMLPTMLLLGAGFTLAYPAANITATSGVADAEQGLAAGLVNTSFQLGGALTLAVAGAVAQGGGDASPVVVSVAVAGLAIAVAGLRR